MSFLPLVVRAADPACRHPASLRVCVLSGEVTEISKAAVLIACCPFSQQKVSRMRVAMIGCEVIASFHLDAKMDLVACFSQNITKGVVSYHLMTTTRTSGGVMSQRLKGIARAKCTLHGIPGKCMCIPNHHFMATLCMDRCIEM